MILSHRCGDNRSVYDFGQTWGLKGFLWIIGVILTQVTTGICRGFNTTGNSPFHKLAAGRSCGSLAAYMAR